MEFQNSPLQLEVDKIFSEENKPVHYYYRVEFHANGETFEPLKVISIDLNRDFLDNFSDEMLISVMMGAGTYLTKLYRNRNFLEATVIREPVMAVSGNSDPAMQITRTRYVAVLIEDVSDPILEATDNTLSSAEALDRSNILTVTLQLMDKAVDLMRMMSVGGVYRYQTVENVIMSIMTNESRKVNLEAKHKLLGVDIITPTHTESLDHVIIPHGTKLMNVPQFVHEKCGGVYSAGLGYYYQNRHWYVYPAYDVTRFKTAKKTLTIINVPTNKYPHVEKTYRLTGSNLTIMATGKVSFEDKSDQQDLTLGNGMRFADAGKYLESFVQTGDNKAIANRAQNVNEIHSKERKSGNNNIQMSGIPSNSNIYVQYSELARRNGATLTAVWENAFPDALYPGMPVRLLYLEGNIVKEVYGILLKAQEYIHPNARVTFASRYIHNVALLIFINNEKTLNT